MPMAPGPSDQWTLRHATKPLLKKATAKATPRYDSVRHGAGPGGGPAHVDYGHDPLNGFVKTDPKFGSGPGGAAAPPSSGAGTGLYDDARTRALGEMDPASQAVGDAKKPDYLAGLYTSQSQGPGMMEQFAQGALGGGNQAYNYLRGEMMKDLQRSSSARGTFNGGAAMRREERGLSDLAAKEYMSRADIANKGQAAQNARVSTLGDLAKGASGEQRDFDKMRIDALGDIGKARGGISERIDLAGLDANQEKELAMLDLALQQKGLTEEQRNNALRNIAAGATAGGTIGGPKGAVIGGSIAAGAELLKKLGF